MSDEPEELDSEAPDDEAAEDINDTIVTGMPALELPDLLHGEEEHADDDDDMEPTDPGVDLGLDADDEEADGDDDSPDGTMEQPPVE